MPCRRNALSTERLADAEAFVDDLRLRQDDGALAGAAAATSAPAFAAVWADPEDAVYDGV